MLPQATGIPQVLAVQLALLVCNPQQAQASAAAFQRAKVRDEWRSHVDEVGPSARICQAGVYALQRK